MSRWLVTHGESQFSAKDLAELKSMATDGRIRPADLIQPPGASDWLYAQELPELKALFPNGHGIDDDDASFGPRSLLPRPVIIALLIAVVVGGLGAMIHFKSIIDSTDVSDSGLSTGEAMLSTDVELRADPNPNGSVMAKLDKGDIVSFKLKQMNLEDGNWWLVSAGGKDGWIPASALPPTFLFDKSTSTLNQGLYYPESYLSVNREMGALPLEDKAHGRGADEYVRIKDLRISNSSEFDLTDVIIVIESLDKKGNVISDAKVEISESIPARSKDLSIGAIFPAFETPEFTHPQDRKRAKLMQQTLDKVGPDDIHYLEAQCGTVQEIFNMAEIMDQIVYQTHEEVMLLDIPSPKPDQRPELWKPCLDVDKDLYPSNTDRIRARIYQVRADPERPKKK
jgi:hypothetical protein